MTRKFENEEEARRYVEDKIMRENPSLSINEIVERTNMVMTAAKVAKELMKDYRKP